MAIRGPIKSSPDLLNYPVFAEKSLDPFMGMDSLISPSPLFEKLSVKSNVQRALDLLIFFLVLSLLCYRLHSLHIHGFSWCQVIAFLCELWFSFIWVFVIVIKWNPVFYKTYPQRLLNRNYVLPPVDVFITTADPELEPPIITINTVLSLLAVDYPANKLACYVSDDGCSPLTFYSLTEAVKFAQLWTPFCKKYNVQVRAPFKYFSKDSPPTHGSSSDFQQERIRMKDEYEELCRKIEEATSQKTFQRELRGDFSVFSNAERHNHPPIIKVIWENEGVSDGLPHVVYVSREKQPKHPHHNKAGAMNVLTRVSGLMTNAPYMLNVDCDMFANNPKVVLDATCVLLSSDSQKDIAFVLFPHKFYDGLKDDPFGNQLVVVQEYLMRGMAGMQGPIYTGTNCFHRRKVIYGLQPHDEEETSMNILKLCGSSEDLAKSVAHAMEGGTDYPIKTLKNSIDEAKEVARCGYENGSGWGNKMGWIYGSLVEDVVTGLMIHKKGWKSGYCTPNPPAFLGCAPSTVPSSLIQQKRGATGLLEILFSKNSPIFAVFFHKLQLRECFGYAWFLSWGLNSVAELGYASLPAYCILSNSHFLPKMGETAIWIPISLFVVYNLQTLSQYVTSGLSVRAWWNNMRMDRIYTMCSSFFGLLSVITKTLGLSETVFEVTKKDQSSSSADAAEGDPGRFTFDESPSFAVGATISLVQVSALAVGLCSSIQAKEGLRVGEIWCSMWLVLVFLPFLRGFWGRGRYGLPLSIKFKSATLALLFLLFCTRTTPQLPPDSA